MTSLQFSWSNILNCSWKLLHFNILYTRSNNSFYERKILHWQWQLKKRKGTCCRINNRTKPWKINSKVISSQQFLFRMQIRSYVPSFTFSMFLKQWVCMSGIENDGKFFQKLDNCFQNVALMLKHSQLCFCRTCASGWIILKKCCEQK